MIDIVIAHIAEWIFSFGHTRYSLKYKLYLKSEKWRQFRQEQIRLANYRCERCERQGSLQVHHRHYRTLGNERAEDVEVLCYSCHRQADKERKARK